MRNFKAQSLAFKNLTHCGTRACIPMQKRSVPGVCNLDATAYFMPTSVANCLSGRYLLRSLKRWKSPGPNCKHDLQLIKVTVLWLRG